LFEVKDHTSLESRIGLAKSVDGFNFVHSENPILDPGMSFTRHDFGFLNHRIVKADDGRYVMTYISSSQKPRISIATSYDLINWENFGQAFRGKFQKTQAKSASIICEMIDNDCVAAIINGYYWMFWSHTDVYVAISTDLIHWEPLLQNDNEDEKNSVLESQFLKIFSPRQGRFDSESIELGPSAVKTDKGIILIYNGKNKWCHYSHSGNCEWNENDPLYAPGTILPGQIVFSAENPTQVIKRTTEPFFHPSSYSPAKNSTLVSGLVFYQNKWFLYYSASDSTISVAIWDGKFNKFVEYDDGSFDGQATEISKNNLMNRKRRLTNEKNFMEIPPPRRRELTDFQKIHDILFGSLREKPSEPINLKAKRMVHNYHQRTMEYQERATIRKLKWEYMQDPL